MRRPWIRRLRLGVPVGLVVVLAAGMAIGLAGRSGRGLLTASVDAGCGPGLVPAEGPARADKTPGGSARHRVCVPLGQPETFQDLYTASTQVAARETAPFSTEASGAYLHAIAQRNAMPAAGTVAGTGGRWKLAGRGPLCAAQTTDSKVCPPPGPNNGDYSYMAPLGYRTLTGRISSFAYDPSRQGRYFASPTVGGVWETLDGGRTWRSIGDGLPSQAVGAIAYDAPLHRIIVGSGDNSFGGSGIAGPGVYFSSNDGRSWHRAAGVPDMILSFKVAVSPLGGGKTLYAATSKGLFRSTNGGVSFVNDKLPTSPKGYTPNCAGNVASRLCFFANDVTDVIVKPTKTKNGPAGAVIAAVGWRAGQAVDVGQNGQPTAGCKMNGRPTDCLQAPQNGLYKSSTGRPGSFSYIPPGPGGVLLPPTNVFGRTALAVAHGPHQNSDAVYALVQDAQKFAKCQDVLDAASPTCNSEIHGHVVATVLDGMYASYDFGKTWTKIMDYTQLKQPGTNSALTAEAGYSPGIQAWYNLWVEADPTSTDPTTGDPTRVLFGLEEVWENNPALPSGGLPGSVLTSPYPTYSGGTAANDPWVVIARYWNACGGVNTPVGPCNPNPFSGGPVAGTTTHSDQHAYAMVPDGKGGVTLLVGSDGGAYKQHVAKGQDFNNNNWGDGLNTTMSALQPYDAEMAKDGTIVSGNQDNGEMKIAPTGQEAEIFGGDGFFTVIDPNNSKNIIEEYTYAIQVNLSNDGGKTWLAIQPGLGQGVTPGPGPCGTATTPHSLFATPIEQDPTKPGHVLLGCTGISEATNAFKLQCSDPSCANVTTFKQVYDLDTLPHPKGADNTPSALAVRGANDYVGYCGYCDPATQGIPFASGIATNVGGTKPPKIGSSNGWHQAAAFCSGCGTANGRLPQRYINSIQEDPHNPNTVYVTLGGYGRRWIPPGSFGENVSNVGLGHVFVSHDHGQHFTNISGNLPDVSANWTALHNGKLLVATDVGVFIQTSARLGRRSAYAVLGRGLPAVPVFTLRADPGNPNKFLIATYGRSDWTYTFTSLRSGTRHQRTNQRRVRRRPKAPRGFTGGSS